MITPKQAQFGFTIVESLMAIVVVAILMTAISPVIILSVATRVQARRVELATLPPKLTLMVSGLGRLLLQAPIQLTQSQYFLESCCPDSTATSLANCTALI